MNTSNTKLSRRWFIGGAASLGALQGCRSFTDPLGCFRSGKANVRFAVISDVHVIAANTDCGLSGNTRTLEHALKWYDAEGVDAVMIAGDIADSGLISELQVFADAWYKIFPNDRSRIDGRKVEKLFIYGNHDVEGYNYGYPIFERNSRDLADDQIFDFGLKRTWERLFNEEYSPVYKKTINGYDFIGAHWDRTVGCDWSGMHSVTPYFAKHGKEIDPSRPFFFFQHPHPMDTCHGPKVWGHDSGVATRALSSFSNAVAFSGHSHHTLLDDRAIWQGAFTSIGTSSLRYGSVSPHISGIPLNQFENFRNAEKENSLQGMRVFRTPLSRQGMLVSVYDDRMVIRRRDFRNDGDIAGDWVVPLPAAESKPFAFAEHAARKSAPKFPQDAQVKAELGLAHTRKTLYKKYKSEEEARKDMIPAVVVRFPAAKRDAEKFAWSYDLNAIDENGKCVKTRRFIGEDVLLPMNMAAKKCEVPFFVDTDFKGVKEVYFEVIAYNCFGKASAKLVSNKVNLAKS